MDGIANVPIAFFKGTADWMFSDSFLDQVSFYMSSLFAQVVIGCVKSLAEGYVA